MAEYVTMLFEAFICLAVAVAIRYAIPYVKAITENEKYSALFEIVTVAVNAAEQTIRESGQGKAKKAQVLAFINGWLADKNLSVSEDTIDRLIEAAVKTMNKEMGKYKED